MNASTTAPQIVMPTPDESGRADRPYRQVKVLGIVMDRQRAEAFDAGIKLIGWKSRAAWAAACIDTVIDQTAEQRNSGVPF